MRCETASCPGVPETDPRKAVNVIVQDQRLEDEMPTIRILVIILCLVGMLGCNEGPNPINVQSIQIVVRDQQSRPVEGAIVQGGFDWTFFQSRTNSQGIALLPADAEGQPVSIYKTNYLPNSVPRVYAGTYPLHETRKKLSLIGSVAGTVIRFGTSELLTLDYQGMYHRYAYDDRSVSEVVTRRLDDSAVAIKSMRLFSDTLWCASHSHGIFVFSLRDPSAPQLLFRLQIPGNLGPFVVKDSLVIVGDPWRPGPVRCFAFRTDGTCTEIARIPDFYVRRMELTGNAVVLLGNSEDLPAVLDISDPSHPLVTYNGREPGYVKGFFSLPFVVLTPVAGLGDAMHPVRCKVLTVSGQAEVTPVGEFEADAWIAGIVAGNIAYGKNYFHYDTISLLEGSVSSGFTTVATMTGYLSDDIGGASPPYFVVGNGLWKLADR